MNMKKESGENRSLEFCSATDSLFLGSIQQVWVTGVIRIIPEIRSVDECQCAAVRGYLDAIAFIPDAEAVLDQNGWAAAVKPHAIQVGADAVHQGPDVVQGHGPGRADGNSAPEVILRHNVLQGNRFSTSIRNQVNPVTIVVFTGNSAQIGDSFGPGVQSVFAIFRECVAAVDGQVPDGAKRIKVIRLDAPGIVVACGDAGKADIAKRFDDQTRSITAPIHVVIAVGSDTADSDRFGCGGEVIPQVCAFIAVVVDQNPAAECDGVQGEDIDSTIVVVTIAADAGFAIVYHAGCTLVICINPIFTVGIGVSVCNTDSAGVTGVIDVEAA